MADPEKRDPVLEEAKERELAQEGKDLSPASSLHKSDGDVDEDGQKLRILQKIEDQKALEEKSKTSFKDLFKRRPKQDLDAIATKASVFDDEVTAKYFQPHPKYENLHRFDPKARWTWREENKIVRKVDWRITLWACIAFFGLDLGRGNLAQANTDDFLPSLGMGRNDYNLGNTVFQVSFLLAEIPSQMISKKVGPDRWIPTIMCAWSLVSMFQFFLSGRTSFLVCRALLGALQGGFIPDVIVYLSYFFKGTELPFRLAIFWTVRRITDIVAPLLAFGVLRMRGTLGYEGWRWLFLIEGFIMLGIGIWSWFMMAASPTQTKGWWRPKGWFDEREETIMTNRILGDDPTKGDMHNRQALTLKALWKSFCDYDLWPIYLLGLVWEMPSGPPDQYLTLTLRDLDFDTFNANLLTIPTQAAGAVTLLVMTYVSERVDQRALFGAVTQLWCLPNLIALAVLPTSVNRWTRFAVVTVLLSYPSPHAIHVGWASRNSNSVRTRAISAALYNMMVQLSRVVYSNIYREDDEPEYRRGNRVLIGICSANLCIYALIKVYYVWKNRSREKKWQSWTPEERVHYLDTTTDTGSKRLDTRFVS